MNFQEFNKIAKTFNQIEKARVRQEKLEKFAKLTDTNEFFVELYFLDGKFEEIELEGIENGVNIFQLYREMGHSLKLRKIVLSTDKGKVKGVNFKY